jgi:hypothetical protein
MKIDPDPAAPSVVPSVRDAQSRTAPMVPAAASTLVERIG